MKKKKMPIRMCIGCRQMKPKNELIRIVKIPEGTINIDLYGKVSGRGAYMCRSEECFNKIVKSKILERTFGQKIDTEIYDKLKMKLNEGE